MKAIETSAVITSITAKQDRSLGLRVSTPELQADEKVEFMNLQGVNVRLLINPLDTVPADVLAVKQEVNQKSQGQRIRSVLFLIWQQSGANGDFEMYYREKTEKYIDYLKEKLL